MGLAAITVAELIYDAGSALIECVAVALRCRRPGGSNYGDEALEQAVEWAVERADGAGFDSTMLVAITHVKNDYARALVARHGFALAEAGDERLTWQLRVDL